MSYRTSGGFPQVSSAVMNIIIINVVVFLAQLVTGGNQLNTPAADLFALHHYKSTSFRPYQVVTYMFMHAGFFHIFFNMFALWMFGTIMEREWGPKRFLIFYFICGIGSAFFQMGSYIHDFWRYDHSVLSPADMEMYQAYLNRVSTVGASGAIMGILAAFGYSYPNMQLFIIPIPFPIKAKYAIIGMIALDVFGGVVQLESDNIAHFAHIGGALIGFLIVLFWNYNKPKNSYY